MADGSCRRELFVLTASQMAYECKILKHDGVAKDGLKTEVVAEEAAEAAVGAEYFETDQMWAGTRDVGMVADAPVWVTGSQSQAVRGTTTTVATGVPGKGRDDE